MGALGRAASLSLLVRVLRAATQSHQKGPPRLRLRPHRRQRFLSPVAAAAGDAALQLATVIELLRPILILIHRLSTRSLVVGGSRHLAAPSTKLVTGHPYRSQLLL
jgi:hypothetical protein